MNSKPTLILLLAITQLFAAQPTTASQLEKAKMLRAKSKFAEAKVLLTEILTLEGSAEAYKEMGNIYLLGERNAKEAQKYYEKALDVEPEYFPAINNLAIVALKNYEATLGTGLGSGDAAYLDKAKYWFEKALKLNSTFAGTYSELAKYHFYRQDHETALETVNYGLTLNGKDPNAYTVRGQILLIGLKKYNEALGDFLKAHKYQPNDPDHVHFIWVCYSKLSRAKDAGLYRKKYQAILRSQGLSVEEINSQIEKQEAIYKTY